MHSDTQQLSQPTVETSEYLNIPGNCFLQELPVTELSRADSYSYTHLKPIIPSTWTNRMGHALGLLLVLWHYGEDA